MTSSQPVLTTTTQVATSAAPVPTVPQPPNALDVFSSDAEAAPPASSTTEGLENQEPNQEPSADEIMEAVQSSGDPPALARGIRPSVLLQEPEIQAAAPNLAAFEDAAAAEAPALPHQAPAAAPDAADGGGFAPAPAATRQLASTDVIGQPRAVALPAGPTGLVSLAAAPAPSPAGQLAKVDVVGQPKQVSSLSDAQVDAVSPAAAPAPSAAGQLATADVVGRPIPVSAAGAPAAGHVAEFASSPSQNGQLASIDVVGRPQPVATAATAPAPARQLPVSFQTAYSDTSLLAHELDALAALSEQPAPAPALAPSPPSLAPAPAPAEQASALSAPAPAPARQLPVSFQTAYSDTSLLAHELDALAALSEQRRPRLLWRLRRSRSRLRPRQSSES